MLMCGRRIDNNDQVSEGRSGMAISAIRSAVEPVDNRAPATAAVELSHELLKTISDGLDVRDVFPRIAQAASQLLQHDCLDLMVQDPFGNAMFRARSAQEFPEDQPAFLADRVLPCSRSARGRVTGRRMGAAHVCRWACGRWLPLVPVYSRQGSGACHQAWILF